MRYVSSSQPARSPVFRGLLSAVLAFGGFSAASQAQELYVICHPSVSLSAADLRDVFLGEKQFAGSVVLSLADNSAARDTFLNRVLRMDYGKYVTAWTKKAFRDGVNPPTVSGSDAEALEYVKRAPGRCSYVTMAPGPGVLIVAKY